MTSIRTEPVTGPSVWRREDVEDPAEWTYELSGAMRAEVSRAAGIATRTYETEDVDLPLVGPLVKQLVDQLEHGRGLVLLKGVPVDGLTVAEAHAVYWALGAHLGTSVAQNGRGEKIVSIRDHGIGKLSGKTVRGYQTNESLPFHSDAPDLAALPARITSTTSCCARRRSCSASTTPASSTTTGARSRRARRPSTTTRSSATTTARSSAATSCASSPTRRRASWG